MLGLVLVAGGGLLVLGGFAGLLASGGDGEVVSADATSTTTVPTSTTTTSTIRPTTTTVATTTTTASTSTTTVPTSTTTTSTSTTTSASTTTIPTESVEEFVPRFSEAIDAGDVEFLLARLHPTVVGGYGEELCRNWIENEILLLRDYRLAGPVSGPTDRPYSAPLGSGVIEDAYSAPVSFVFQGQSFDSEGGFAPIDGVMYWLGQCR